LRSGSKILLGAPAASPSLKPRGVKEFTRRSNRIAEPETGPRSKILPDAFRLLETDFIFIIGCHGTLSSTPVTPVQAEPRCSA
jgi:hypothetical protein